MAVDLEGRGQGSSTTYVGWWPTRDQLWAWLKRRAVIYMTYIVGPQAHGAGRSSAGRWNFFILCPIYNF